MTSSCALAGHYATHLRITLSDFSWSCLCCVHLILFMLSNRLPVTQNKHGDMLKCSIRGNTIPQMPYTDYTIITS